MENNFPNKTTIFPGKFVENKLIYGKEKDPGTSRERAEILCRLDIRFNLLKQFIRLNVFDKLVAVTTLVAATFLFIFLFEI
jgi:hypothetical protein